MTSTTALLQEPHISFIKGISVGLLISGISLLILSFLQLKYKIIKICNIHGVKDNK